MALIEANRVISGQEEKFKANLAQEKVQFAAELATLESDFTEIKKFDSYASVSKYGSFVVSLNEKIEKAKEKIKSFNERESLFKEDVSEYESLETLQTRFEPYSKMWMIAI
jgi:dynein heavy chain